MADIIMQGTARGLESKSRGMRDLSAGISKMGDMYTSRKEREEDKAIEAKKWDVKKRFMNAQADAQETSAKVAKKGLKDKKAFDAGLKYSADKGYTDAETERHLIDVGVGSLAGQWRSGKEANDSEMLAQETTKLSALADKSKALHNNFASVETEEQFNQALAYSTKQFEMNPLEGAQGTWQEQLKMVMGNTMSMQQLAASKKDALIQSSKTKTEKLVDAAHRAKKSGDPLMIESTQKDLESQSRKVSALADMKEMDLFKKQREDNLEYADNASSILDTYFNQDTMTGADAKSEGYSQVVQHIIKQQENGWEPARTQKWLEGFVTKETEEGWAPFGLADGPTKIVINELAPDPVSMRGGDVHSMVKQKAEKEGAAAPKDKYEYKVVNGKKMRRKVK